MIGAKNKKKRECRRLIAASSLGPFPRFSPMFYLAWPIAMEIDRIRLPMNASRTGAYQQRCLSCCYTWSTEKSIYYWKACPPFACSLSRAGFMRDKFECHKKPCGLSAPKKSRLHHARGQRMTCILPKKQSCLFFALCLLERPFAGFQQSPSSRGHFSFRPEVSYALTSHGICCLDDAKCLCVCACVRVRACVG